MRNRLTKRILQSLLPEHKAWLGNTGMEQRGQPFTPEVIQLGLWLHPESSGRHLHRHGSRLQ